MKAATPGSQPLDTPWWNNGNAFRSRLLDAFSVFFPDGEKFFCKAMQDWLASVNAQPRVSSDLKQEVQRFIREEASHSRAHGLYNTRMAEHSSVIQTLERRMAAVMAEMGQLDLSKRIAFIAAFEQLTGLLSREVLRKGSAWLSTGDTPQRRLWIWHSQEELAHGAVAVEVLRVSGFGRASYTLVFAASVFFLVSDFLTCCTRLCWDDVRSGRVSGARLTAQAAAFMVEAIPSLARIASGCIACVSSYRPIR